MNVYTCTEFTGFWPVGAAAVVVAPDSSTAADMLNAELRKISLPGDAKTKDMQEVPTSAPLVCILLDGNY